MTSEGATSSSRAATRANGELTAHTEGAALSVVGVSRRFGDVVALDRLGFEVMPGELYGLVGPDGAGKTTAVRVMSGLLLPDSGSCRVFGSSPTRSEVRERLGLMPQQYSLYRDLSVQENLAFFAELNALPRRVFEERKERLLSITRLAPFLDRRAEALSGGMYKKLALSCALLHQPDVLLLDEPTNGVDPVSRRELWELLYEFAGHGMAVLISTPYMDEAERCHKVGLLHQGRLVLEGAPADLLREFGDETYDVVGGERHAIERALREVAEVFAASPAGSRLRLVVEGGAAPIVKQLLARHGGTLQPVKASFEDLYLARLKHVAKAQRSAPRSDRAQPEAS
jgi:ABC-2 type transport system ATP-binding protein